jgi:hypothetical protein
MHWPNLERLSPHDEVKFVIADRVDFDYACDVVTRYDLTARAAAVLFSPVHGALAPRSSHGGFWPLGCPCGCSFSSTSTSGVLRHGSLGN